MDPQAPDIATPFGLNINAILALALAEPPPKPKKDSVYMRMNTKQPLFERVLDALAEIAVENPGNTMALAVSFPGGETDRLKVYLSGSDNISERTLAHLKRIWAIMGNIAYSFLCPHNPAQSRDIKTLRAEMLLEIYSFCYARFKNRLNKWTQVLKDFYHRLSQYMTTKRLETANPHDKMEDILDTFREVESTLECIARLFHAMPEELDGVNPRSQGWLNFVRCMDYLSVLSEDIQTVSLIFENFEVQMDSARRFGPVYALQRVMALQQLGDIIFDFTGSPRFPPSRYNSAVEFIILPPAYTTHSIRKGWPKTMGEWKDLRAALYCSEGYRPRAETETESVTIPNIPNPHICCEWTLIQHLDSPTTPCALDMFTPPLDYIGLSKPPSYFSNLWLTMYNAFAHRGHYVMRASESKWPGQWVLPQIGFNEVAPTFLKEVIAKYCIHQEEIGKALLQNTASGVAP